ncbi:DUF2779 domain-containing protein [Qipengyuania marisflavi]|uniref:DUF2779 domain-containing protein n=1 Tax=Qipengyuania marisflavi TaxID=2486356 RepID=A0A5S3NXH1_9SPHN|nr:DUF2779 domain-containing protein [Qipengyuania marisflavi]TMM44982.1 DUF2779 domain-containing protein [Qipengyuania marisflavi]
MHETTPHRRYGLSKSRITSFEQCPKKLWLSVHKPELAQYDEGAEMRFSGGNEVGEIACALHTQGVMVEAEPNLTAALATTARLLAEDHPGPIFEATFEHDGVLVRVDVLERAGESSWHAAEVKSSTSVKDYHHGDLATQVWVMRGAGLNLESAAIRHIDKSFELTSAGDYAGLFRDAELMGEVDDIVTGRAALVQEAQAVLADDEPTLQMGDHCSSPFECEFATYCGKALPEGPDWPVTVLPRGAGKKWLEKGIEDLLDLSEEDLSAKNAQILSATRDDVPYHDVEGARREMADWGWPRAWLDFETIAPAVPRWIGTRPYQQIPFQFSLHLEQRDGTITHHEFLSCDGSDPRRACAEALISMVPDDATIIAYYAPFERRVLRDLAAWEPDLAGPLLVMAEATVDLLPVTRNNWYHRDQRGSWSIKAVLPTIAPELDYASLEVKDGGNAQLAWAEAAQKRCSVARREALAEALKAYCQRDTWAMITIARALGAENE